MNTEESMNFNNREEFDERLSRLVARTWLEPEFEQFALANPKQALAAVGLPVGENATVEIDRSNDFLSDSAPFARDVRSAEVFRLPLPARPSHLADRDLQDLQENCTGSIIPCSYDRPLCVPLCAK